MYRLRPTLVRGSARPSTAKAAWFRFTHTRNRRVREEAAVRRAASAISPFPSKSGFGQNRSLGTRAEHGR
jgi:hypothetical protein